MRWNQQRSTRSPRFSHISVRFADNPAGAARSEMSCRRIVRDRLEQVSGRCREFPPYWGDGRGIWRRKPLKTQIKPTRRLALLVLLWGERARRWSRWRPKFIVAVGGPQIL